MATGRIIVAKPGQVLSSIGTALQLVLKFEPMKESESPIIALVDDEQNIRETVGYAIRKAGYRVSLFADGLEAWSSFENSLPDLVILDVIMPRMDGLELCRRIRSLSDRIPLIFLTSRDEEFDRILGLELGADDYLCKPFSTRELIARIKVLFRRLALSNQVQLPEEEDTIECGEMRIDRLRFTATWREQSLPLTVTEFRMLQALIAQPGHVKTRRQLIREAYPDDTYVSERTVDTHIKRIRKKLVQVDPDFSAVESIYGLGYRYNPPV
jgi:two-component system response regulator ChvI